MENKVNTTKGSFDLTYTCILSSVDEGIEVRSYDIQNFFQFHHHTVLVIKTHLLNVILLLLTAVVPESL